MCRVVILLIKSIAVLPFSLPLPSPSWFLKLPTYQGNLSLYNRQRILIHIVKSEVKYLGQFAILRKPNRSGSVISSLSLLLNSTTL